MTVVYNTINLPAGEVATRAKVKLQLIASTAKPNSPGWHATNDVAIHSTQSVDVDTTGRWEATVVGNDDPELAPLATAYRVTEKHATHPSPVVYHIDVPYTGGPYWVGAIQSQAPTELADAHSLLVPEGTIVGRLVGSPGLEAISLADLKSALDALP